jgi:hypothetical protein
MQARPDTGPTELSRRLGFLFGADQRAARPWRSAFATLAVAALSGGVAAAQDEPPEGCFCLAEAGRTLPQIIRGCTREKFPNRFFWSAVCRYRDGNGDEVVTDPIMITEDWVVLPMGHADCSACEPEKREGPVVPRGHGGEETE